MVWRFVAIVVVIAFANGGSPFIGVDVSEVTALDRVCVCVCVCVRACVRARARARVCNVSNG